MMGYAVSFGVVGVLVAMGICMHGWMGMIGIWHGMAWYGWDGTHLAAGVLIFLSC